jgi:hypothetical protein
MGFFSRLFGTSPESAYKTCVNIYEKAKRKNPNKSEIDYLKFVLLTKPPYDYQLDVVIDLILVNCCNISQLAKYIADGQDPINRDQQKDLWSSRERNLKFAPKVKKRNEEFFAQFWN